MGYIWSIIEWLNKSSAVFIAINKNDDFILGPELFNDICQPDVIPYKTTNFRTIE